MQNREAARRLHPVAGTAVVEADRLGAPAAQDRPSCAVAKRAAVSSEATVMVSARCQSPGSLADWPAAEVPRAFSGLHHHLHHKWTRRAKKEHHNG